MCSESLANSDIQLIDLALEGQTEAFGRLVLKYQDRLYNTVFHVVGHEQDARDIVQEALVQAFLKLETFRHQSGFFTWLYRIAFNAAMTHQRRRRPVASIDGDRHGDRCFDPPGSAEPPCQAVERAEQCEQVRKALTQLSDEHRAILVLREMEGCNYETIAEVLGVPLGTVRSRLYRARLQLKEVLSREGVAMRDY